MQTIYSFVVWCRHLAPEELQFMGEIQADSDHLSDPLLS